ncbi:flavin reductase family protein [Methylobacterium sp. ID0610]|uniref:flavin reductase family protein n=1 Tax=Methylobacterium carpenticola TaxID=3344827 RepID=UPI00368D4BD8
MADSLADDFRLSMRRLAATVCILTCAEEGAWFGMVATSVAAASLEPPALTVGVNRSASIHDPIRRTRLFGVNLLRSHHDALALAFTRAPAERFAEGRWRSGPEGLPLLADAQASLVCAVDAELSYGSHTLFVGRLAGAAVAPAVDPLLWQDGGFAVGRPLPLPA